MCAFNLKINSQILVVLLLSVVACQQVEKEWKEYGIDLERAMGSAFQASAYLEVRYLSMIEAWERINV